MHFKAVAVPIQKAFPAKVALLLSLAVASLASAQSRVVVTLPDRASATEKVASSELVTHLRALYPAVKFEEGGAVAGDPVVYLGTAQDLPERFAQQVKGSLTGTDSYAVKTIGTHEAVIAGSSPRATLFAVYALLEKLGFGFYLSYNTAPAPRQSPFSFADWDLADTPIAGERVIFNWHNFLSGCSTWNLEDWQLWITQAARMRFNTVMVHAYGNNPMVSFSFNGQTKPTGYLANTKLGRDWGTQHVLDVRKMVAADGFYDGPVFGADASLVPDGGTVQAARSLMQGVFRFAAERGMGVAFALDVDWVTANPQNVIATLPASARFENQGLQLVNPDTPEGYAYYRAQIEQLMQVYPQITQLVLWFRDRQGSPWTALPPEKFPPAWRDEYSKAVAADSTLRKDAWAPGMFAIARIARAFRKALDETGHRDVTLGAGSWRFEFLPSANAFMPRGVALMPLDYDFVYPSDPAQSNLRRAGRDRPVVPIVWAQHDDREYAGRSYTPFAGFGSMLRGNNSAGYGVIHWTTRPLDLYFRSLADQVWTTTEDKTLDATASEMAEHTFGPQAREIGKEYLLRWIYGAPAFGRETSDAFLDQRLDVETELNGAKVRLALLEKMRGLAQSAAERDWVGYFEDWEHYAAGVHQAQGQLQQSQSAMKAGNIGEARQAIAKADPESVIETYARTIRHGQTDRGEKGLLISLNLRWLPYFEAQRQELGLEPLQIEFAPTYHEPLAWGVGRFTYDFDAKHRVLEVLGASELGTEVKDFEAGSACASGIEVSKPVPLAVGGLADTPLHGAWRMKLTMPNAAEVQVEAEGKSQAATRDSEMEVKAADGKIHFTLSPVKGPARVCGLTLKAVAAAQ